MFLKLKLVYLPLLDQLSSHFTEFYIDYVKDFTRLSSYNLYVYLCSWQDSNYQVQNKKIAKKDLPKIFNLKEGEYWRNYGKENAKFHFADFEKYCLNPAIEEINKLKSCDMHILSCDKIKQVINYQQIQITSLEAHKSDLSAKLENVELKLETARKKPYMRENERLRAE